MEYERLSSIFTKKMENEKWTYVNELELPPSEWLHT